MIEILLSEKDDKDFIEIIEQVLRVGLNLAQPQDVFLVRTNQWFDFK